MIVIAVKVGVSLTLSKNDDGQFLSQVARTIRRTLLLQKYLFAVAASTGGSHSGGGVVVSDLDLASTATQASTSLIICGSDEGIVQRAALLASSKFLGRRVQVIHDDGKEWAAFVEDIGASTYDGEVRVLPNTYT
jgi:hypothetical protein